MSPHYFDPSRRYDHLPCWPVIYQARYPSLTDIIRTKPGGPEDRAGIDLYLVLADGDKIAIDEKARPDSRRSDILLELTSQYYVDDPGHNMPGWTWDMTKLTEVVAYNILLIELCYLIPYSPLRQALHDNEETWIRRYGWASAPNVRYETRNVAVPYEDLLRYVPGITRHKYGT